MGESDDRPGREERLAAPLSSIGPRGKADAMGESDDRPGREERLAAKLRENLRRRKVQARAMDDKPPLPKQGADG